MPKTIEEAVAEWNETYMRMVEELGLKDLTDEEYEVEVGSALLGVCDEDNDLAVAVFNHPNNVGGWGAGDVGAFLVEKKLAE